MKNFQIEKVTTKDAAELLKIYGPYVEKTAISFEYEIPSVEEFANRIDQISNRYPYLKVVSDGEILGYAYANTFKARASYDWAVETTIYVREDCKGSGIGRLLYDALEASLKNMGILSMNACIASTDKEGVYLTNDSMHFHEKMGFALVGKFHSCGYKFDRWFDMIWMEKMIGEHVAHPTKVSFGDWNI